MREPLKDYWGIKDYDVLEDFSSTSNWSVATGSNSDITANIERVEHGTSSMKVTMNGKANSIQNIDRTNLNLSLDGKNKQFVLRFWIENPDQLKQITFYFATSDGWGDIFKYSILRQQNLGGKFVRGWNYYVISHSEGEISGGFSWSKPIRRIRLALTQKTDAVSNVVFDSILYNGKSEPRILFTFDDGWKTVYDNAFPKMQQVGITGTIYVIPFYTQSSILKSFFSTAEEFREMTNAGWTMGNHTWNHDYYLTRNWDVDGYLNQIKMAKDWLIENVNQGNDDWSFLCFPNGEYDYAILDELHTLGIQTARPAYRRGMNPNNIDTLLETSGRNFSHNITVAEAKDWVDWAIDEGATQYFMFHQIPIDDTSTGERENPNISWSKWKFEELCDYVAERKAQKYITTNSEWYHSRHNPRFTRKSFR